MNGNIEKVGCRWSLRTVLLNRPRRAFDIYFTARRAIDWIRRILGCSYTLSARREGRREANGLRLLTVSRGVRGIFHIAHRDTARSCRHADQPDERSALSTDSYRQP